MIVSVTDIQTKDELKFFKGVGREGGSETVREGVGV